MDKITFNNISYFAGAAYKLTINPLKPLRKKFPEYKHSFSFVKYDVTTNKDTIFYCFLDESLIVSLVKNNRLTYQYQFNF
jgi:hypothetical protein